jgi:hypothetical protein
MNLFKYLLTLMVTLGVVFSAYADPEGSKLDDLNERDWQALYDYIKERRSTDLEEKTCNLTISGDVRTEWRSLQEKQCGKKLRGRGSYDQRKNLPIGRNDFDIEFRLRFDYVCGNSWAVAQLQFDNSAGVDDNDIPCNIEKEIEVVGKDGKKTKKKINCGDPEGFHGSGFCDDLCLKKCYWGYNIYSCEESRLDIEVGRRNLYDIFDSRVQFLSRFDGVFLKYSSAFETIGNWYWSVAGFVVDERVNHFAWVTEIGFLNIMDTGLDLKYSFIDWRKNGRNRCFKTCPKGSENLPGSCDFVPCSVNNPVGFKFLISQWTLAYHVDPALLCDRPAMFYGAFLWNHDSHGRYITNYPDCNNGVCCKTSDKRRKIHGQNLAGYAGVLVGEVIGEGDWALDIRWEYVQAFAMPDDDMGGIGRGNVRSTSVTQNGARGNTNYQGWRIEGLYGLTDNLSLDTIVEFSRQIDKKIGGSHRYSKFELEAIYAF